MKGERKETQWKENGGMGRWPIRCTRKSFLDTNGDGIGDLRDYQQTGLSEGFGCGYRVDFAGVLFAFVDQGYDISDYYNIDPCFGTMEDMDELLAEAKKRDMAVLMDLVVNHCSNEHEWFQKALADPDGGMGSISTSEKEKRAAALQLALLFWRQCLGADSGTNKYYLHLFAGKGAAGSELGESKLREEIYK